MFKHITKYSCQSRRHVKWRHFATRPSTLMSYISALCTSYSYHNGTRRCHPKKKKEKNHKWILSTPPMLSFHPPGRPLKENNTSPCARSSLYIRKNSQRSTLSPAPARGRKTPTRRTTYTIIMATPTLCYNLYYYAWKLILLCGKTDAASATRGWVRQRRMTASTRRAAEEQATAVTRAPWWKVILYSNVLSYYYCDYNVIAVRSRPFFRHCYTARTLGDCPRGPGDRFSPIVRRPRRMVSKKKSTARATTAATTSRRVLYFYFNFRWRFFRGVVSRGRLEPEASV